MERSTHVNGMVGKVIGTTVVSGNGVAGSEEAKRGVCDGVHGEAKRSEIMAKRSLDDSFERVHGVLGKCCWVYKVVLREHPNLGGSG